VEGVEDVLVLSEVVLGEGGAGRAGELVVRDLDGARVSALEGVGWFGPDTKLTVAIRSSYNVWFPAEVKFAQPPIIMYFSPNQARAERGESWRARPMVDGLVCCSMR
jgi:hypothetical protein